MILRRLGNKSNIAQDIQKYFPKHEVYIELFFGAGGMFFNKPIAKRNILNDIDNDVFNLFMIIKNEPKELLSRLEITPFSDSLFEYWKKEQEEDKYWRAIRFIYLSNFGLFGKQSSLQVSTRNHKKQAIKNYHNTIEFLKEISTAFLNCDFRQALKQISFSEQQVNEKTFIYADPPYLSTDNNYSDSFKEQDSIDLFDCLQKTNCKFAMSEFDNDFIIEQANQRGLNIIYIGERKNINNRRTEILITNYENNTPTLF